MAGCDKGTSTASRPHARQSARLVSLLPAVAILGLWAAAWAPINQTSRADAKIGLSDAAIKVPDLQHGDGNGVRNGAQPDNIPPRVVQLTAEKIRLEAERDGATELHFPSGFAWSDRGAAAAAREGRLFETRRAAVRRQKALLGQRIVEMRHEVAGLLLQQRAREKEVHLFREELRLIEDMHGRKLINVARLMGLRRDLARSEGEVGGLAAQVARARAQIEEIEMQIFEVEQKAVLEAHKEIRDVDARIDELSGRGT